jgi:hypothetical protein
MIAVEEILEEIVDGDVGNRVKIKRDNIESVLYVLHLAGREGKALEVAKIVDAQFGADVEDFDDDVVPEDLLSWDDQLVRAGLASPMGWWIR